MVRLTFLGTAGGRFATITQMRYSGGIYLEDDVRVHIDPGPGALRNAWAMGLDPFRTDGILISHCHPDHYNDAEVLIEAMTRGGWEKRGILVGSHSVIDGKSDVGPAISRYHSSLPQNIFSLEAGDKVRIGNLLTEATPSVHNDPSTIGFRFTTSAGIVSYVSDTELTPDIIDVHASADLLVLSVVQPRGRFLPTHMSTDDAMEFVKWARPKLAVLTHLGINALKGDPKKEAEWIEEETGIPTISALDGMSISWGKEGEGPGGRSDPIRRIRGERAVDGERLFVVTRSKIPGSFEPRFPEDVLKRPKLDLGPDFDIDGSDDEKDD